MATPTREGSPGVVRRAPTLARRLTVEVKDRLIGDYIDKALKESELSESPMNKTLSSKQHPAQQLQTPGMVISVWGSPTTSDDKYAPYFAQKGMHFDGDLGTMCHRIGLMSHRGYKPESPNQDDFFVLSRPESLLFGVFDGHGPEGHEVAHFAQERLPTYITERLRKDPDSWDKALKSSLEELSRHLEETLGPKAQYSGATMTVAMLDREPAPATVATAGEEAEEEASGRGEKEADAEPLPLRLRLAFLGDSIAVAGKRPARSKSSWIVSQLTPIHRPDREDEAARIEEFGGTIQYEMHARLLTPEVSLAVSRSIGDLHAARYGLSSEPEIVPPLELETDHEHILLVCSDGIWDVISPAQAVAFVGKFRPEEAQLAAERLVGKAQLRWQEQHAVVDDITAIIVWPSFAETGQASAATSPVARKHSSATSAPEDDCGEGAEEVGAEVVDRKKNTVEGRSGRGRRQSTSLPRCGDEQTAAVAAAASAREQRDAASKPATPEDAASKPATPEDAPGKPSAPEDTAK